MKTICFDLDGVLCDQVEKEYSLAKPKLKAIRLLNSLYDQGYRIIIHTARFMGRCDNDSKKVTEEWFSYTESQLKGWNVKYHELIMGKPRYDLVIDDRSVFFHSDWEKIEEEVLEKLSP